MRYVELVLLLKIIFLNKIEYPKQEITEIANIKKFIIKKYFF